MWNFQGSLDTFLDSVFSFVNVLLTLIFGQLAEFFNQLTAGLVGM
jgi:hypothetical protein